MLVTVNLTAVQADQQIGDSLLLLRNQVNLVLEQARNKKLLGSALEAKVLLHVADVDQAASLNSLNAAANGADPLRYAFITSQAQLVDSQVPRFACWVLNDAPTLCCAVPCCVVLGGVVMAGSVCHALLYKLLCCCMLPPHDVLAGSCLHLTITYCSVGLCCQGASVE